MPIPPLHAGDRRRYRQVLHGHLARPPTFFHPFVRIGERVFEWQDIGMIGIRRQYRIEIFVMERLVFRPIGLEELRSCVAFSTSCCS
jgi:hypothetical protein